MTEAHSILIRIRADRAAGFTLLEIVLVMVIISVITALVAPSLLPKAAHDAADETHRLQQALRMAVDEAQLTGVPLRWWARADRYGFERFTDHRWQPASAAVFSTRKLDGVVIDRVVENGEDQHPEADGGAPGGGDQRASDRHDLDQQEPLVGRVVMLPNGMVTVVDIALRNSRGDQAVHWLQVRPGPSGITEKDAR